MSSKKTFPLDPRPLSALMPYHRRARTRQPWLQGLAFVVLIPLMLLICRVRVRGTGNIPKGPFILAPNHPSVLDPILVSLPLRRRVHFMGKSDLFTRRWGRWLGRLGGFPVRRGVWDTEAFSTAVEVLDRGGVVFMAFEGGVSHVKQVGRGLRRRDEVTIRQAKPGVGHLARLAGATVVPVHITGARGLYRPWTWPKITITYGVPLQFDRDHRVDRDGDQQAAERIASAVKQLA